MNMHSSDIPHRNLRWVIDIQAKNFASKALFTIIKLSEAIIYGVVIRHISNLKQDPC